MPPGFLSMQMCVPLLRMYDTPSHVQERAVWRVRVLGLSAGGESPEDLVATVNNLLAFDGGWLALCQGGKQPELLLSDSELQLENCS